jgi:hypothetical protein
LEAVLRRIKRTGQQTFSLPACLLALAVMLYLAGIRPALAFMPAAADDPSPPHELIIQKVKAHAQPQLTPYPAQLQSGQEDRFPSLLEFARQVMDGSSGEPRGLYAEGRLALRILDQPAGLSSYVAPRVGTATLFQSAAGYHVIGLLAHNYLSGRDFYRLQLGDELYVVYGDGRLRGFTVQEIADFQRLRINDPRSNFRALPLGQLLTADQLFMRFYEQPDQLVMQTCLERYGALDWGVHMVRAAPKP